MTTVASIDDRSARARTGSPAAREGVITPGHRGWAAWRDLRQAFGLRTLWVTMGIQGIRRKYRRSVLGPLWLTVSLAFLVAVLGSLYGRLMGVPYETYVPHLAPGFIAWQFIQGVVNESCNVFIASKGWILNIRSPLLLYVFRLVWEHLLVLAHNGLVYIGVALLFGIAAGWPALLLVPALGLMLLNALWTGVVLGAVCARFRDVPQIVQSLMRVAFFATPVIWMPSQLGERAELAYYNPFAYFVELLRAPLLGTVPPLGTWAIAVAITAVGVGLAAAVFVVTRPKIAYWL